MKQVVLFSGLGADERVFSFLNLGPVEKICIRWEMPAKGESLPQYAQRLLPQIKFINPILIGVSFGGMVATEISKLISTERVILISSASSYLGIPSYFRWSRWLKLHSILPLGIAKKPGRFLFTIIGISKEEDKKLLGSILGGTDPVFLRRAVSMILRWRNTTLPTNLVQIHGMKDRLLPCGKNKYDKQIPDGGHFMIVTHASELSNHLQKIIHS